jgi:hypothetical protein
VRVGMGALGQAASATPTACTLTDYLTLANLWNGCVPSSGVDVETACNIGGSYFYPAACSNPNNPPTLSQTLPAVPAQYGSSPTPPAGYTAVQSGTDSNGNPIYVYQPDADTIHAAQVAAITQNTANNQPVDCTQWYNNLFNPQCTCTYCDSATFWIAVAGAGFLVLMMVTRR